MFFLLFYSESVAVNDVTSAATVTNAIIACTTENSTNMTTMDTNVSDIDTIISCDETRPTQDVYITEDTTSNYIMNASFAQNPGNQFSFEQASGQICCTPHLTIRELPYTF